MQTTDRTQKEMAGRGVGKRKSTNHLLVVVSVPHALPASQCHLHLKFAAHHHAPGRNYRRNSKSGASIHRFLLLTQCVLTGNAARLCRVQAEILPEYNAIPTTASIPNASRSSISCCVLMPPATTRRREVARRIAHTASIGIPPINPSVSICV